MSTRPHLPAEEVRKAVERRSPSRVPMMIHNWNGPDAFGDRAPAVRELQAQYPSDWVTITPRLPKVHVSPADPDYLPGYSWLPWEEPEGAAAARGHDASVWIEDWSLLDEVLAALPDPSRPEVYAGRGEDLAARAGNRYTAMHWWYCYYERLWSLRGMENILVDFYTEPDAVHALMDGLTDVYLGWIHGAAALGVDAIYTTDDIGMQTGTMFNLDIFREFFKPRYARLINAAHEHNMHFWLHTCGNVLQFLDDFVEIGLDVIHPIQKYTMDEREIAAKYGDRLSFWTGMDVQHILPKGTPDDVRAEVRFMIDTFDRPDGGCMVTAGNGITADVPLDNLAAFYDETYSYGLAHRRAFR